MEYWLAAVYLAAVGSLRANLNIVVKNLQYNKTNSRGYISYDVSYEMYLFPKIQFISYIYLLKKGAFEPETHHDIQTIWKKPHFNIGLE